MKLACRYLGLHLPHPFVAGASPLADNLDRARRLEDAGIAAIVMRSLFEEQIDQEALAHHEAEVHIADSHGEATTYLPACADCVFGPDEYLEQLQRLKQAVAVPVIASLNGYTEGGWIDFAKRIDSAGADALELNLYSVATDPGESAEELESRAVAIVGNVVRAVSLPVAVKLSPFHTSLANFALRLEDQGIAGLVLFNRFFEPDIDLEQLETRVHMELSDRKELGLRLRWLALLSGHLRCDLAVSGGVHTETDAIKAIMSGAHAVQVVGELLRGGLGRVGELKDGLARWLDERGYESLRQLRGSMDCSRTPDPQALERVNYMRVLQTWRGL